MTDQSYSLASLLGDYAYTLPPDRVASRLGILADTNRPEVLDKLLDATLNIQDLEDEIDKYIEAIVQTLKDNHIDCEVCEIDNTLTPLRFEVDPKSERLEFKPKPNRKIVKFELSFADEHEEDGKYEFYIDPYQDLVYGNNAGITNAPFDPARLTYSSLKVLINSISGQYLSSESSLDAPIIFPDSIPNISIASFNSPKMRINHNFYLRDTQNNPSSETAQKQILHSVVQSLILSDSVLAIANKEAILIPIYDFEEKAAFIVGVPYPDSTQRNFDLEEYVRDSIKRIAISLGIEDDSTRLKVRTLDFKNIDADDPDLYEHPQLDKAVYYSEQVLRKLENGEQDTQDLLEYLTITTELAALSIATDSYSKAHSSFIKFTRDLKNQPYVDPGIVFNLIISCINNLPTPDSDKNIQEIKERHYFAKELAAEASKAYPLVHDFKLLHLFNDLITDKSLQKSEEIISELESTEDISIQNHPAYSLILSIAHSRTGNILRASDYEREYERITEISLYFYSSAQDAWWGWSYDKIEETT